MKKIDIYSYRSSKIEEKKIINLNVDMLKELLNKRGLVLKSCGLCSEPWDKY